jgi:hypothetical protein
MQQPKVARLEKASVRARELQGAQHLEHLTEVRVVMEVLSMTTKIYPKMSIVKLVIQAHTTSEMRQDMKAQVVVVETKMVSLEEQAAVSFG